MTHAAHQLDRHSGAWHNRLPAWILEDEAQLRLVRSIRRTLQAIADKCTVDADGNLVGAFGGQHLAAAAGCSMRSLWNHIARLEQLGFVVTIGRGGTVGDRNYGNIYAIPAARGSLDLRRAQRAMRIMVRGEDNVLRPQTIQPGDQVTVWIPPASRGEAGASPAKSGQASRGSKPSAPVQAPGKVKSCTGVVKSCTGGSCNSARGGRAKLHTTHSSLFHSPSKNHPVLGGAARTEGGEKTSPATPVIVGVRDEDLRSRQRLLEILDQAIALELVSRSERDRLRVFAAAAHALRVGHHPARLFISTLVHQRWHVIGQADEDAAQELLKPPAPRRSECKDVNDVLSSPLPAAPLRPELKIVIAAVVAGGRLQQDPYYIARGKLPDLTRDQFDALRAEAGR